MKIYLVGGAVRDKLLGLPIKEKDWVVVGATPKEMLNQKFRQVGKEFPVFLHPESGEEYALARMESKTKPGYQGFSFDASPEVSLKADLKRRDLTINAMAYDFDTDDIIDPYGGQKDIKNKVLRHVSPAFAEDPVRILRVGRFLARYAHLGFHVDKETIQLMQNMVAKGEVNALVAERVWKELERALGEPNPEKFFEVLADCHALPILFPHLKVKGPGINALLAAAQLTHSAPVRFASLLHAVPENAPDATEQRKSITALCDRYRAPNIFRELAVLTAINHQEALKSPHLTAKSLLHLFNALDIYRREERFSAFLIACKAIALSKGLDFNIQWLFEAGQAAKSVDIKALLQEGYAGPAFAIKLKAERLEKLSEWLKKNA